MHLFGTPTGAWLAGLFLVAACGSARAEPVTPSRDD
jgi:hypothetical protein